MAATSVKEKLMKAAIRSFADQGFDATTMREIASRAGVTLPTLYHYYGDKRSLFEAVCLETFESRARRGAASFESSGLPLEQKLIEFFAGLADTLLNNENYFKLMHREIIDQDLEGIRKLSERCWSKPFATVCGAYRRLLPKNTDVVSLAFAGFALLYGLVEFRRKAPFLDEALVRHYSPQALAVLVLGTTVPSVPWQKFIARAAA